MEERKYTKEELINAQYKYNLYYMENKDEFLKPEEEDLSDKETAISQIDFLLSQMD